MMPPNFKQALVEKGVLGSLVFIATHTDVLMRSEVAENLNLRPDASALECALARSDYFRSTLDTQFHRGMAGPGDGEAAAQPTRRSTVLSQQRLHELLEQKRQYHANVWAQLSRQLQASSEVTQAQRLDDDLALRLRHLAQVLQVLQHQAEGQQDAALQQCLQQVAANSAGASFEFVSFAVSAVGYQKLAGLRRGDGPALFASVAHTQIPGLRAFVSATASLQRLNPFKAGAELVRCLEEAKKAAEEEEEAMTREEVSSVQISSLPHTHKFLEGVYKPTGMPCGTFSSPVRIFAPRVYVCARKCGARPSNNLHASRGNVRGEAHVPEGDPRTIR